MSTIMAAIISFAAPKKQKEHPLAPFKRSLELASEEEKKALVDLECATNDLACAVQKRESER